MNDLVNDLYGWDTGEIYFAHLQNGVTHEHPITQYPMLKQALIGMCVAFFERSAEIVDIETAFKGVEKDMYSAQDGTDADFGTASGASDRGDHS